MYSSYALHHLNRNDKQAVVGESLEILRPAGWFLNADIVVAESPQVEQRLQELESRGSSSGPGGETYDSKTRYRLVASSMNWKRETGISLRRFWRNYKY